MRGSSNAPSDDVYKLPKLRRDPRAGARTICTTTTACVADIGAAMTEAVEQPVDSVLDILPAPVREAGATVTASSPSSFAWVPAMCRRFALAFDQDYAAVKAEIGGGAKPAFVAMLKETVLPRRRSQLRRKQVALSRRRAQAHRCPRRHRLLSTRW